MEHIGTYTGAELLVRTDFGEEIKVPHGAGTYTYPDGHFSLESANWSHGRVTGHGTLRLGPQPSTSTTDATACTTDATGARYTGDFVRGQMTGQGERVWADGSAYRGGFLRGEPHGPGVWAGARAGELYQGEFAHGRRHGPRAVLQSADGSVHAGGFADHQRSGFGAHMYGPAPPVALNTIPPADLQSAAGSDVAASGVGRASAAGEWAASALVGAGNAVAVPFIISNSSDSHSHGHNGNAADAGSADADATAAGTEWQGSALLVGTTCSNSQAHAQWQPQAQ